MCGRYALYGPKTRLREAMLLEECPDYAERYNIPPQSEIPIMRFKPEVGRVGQLVKWGLIPSWAKDPSIGAKLNNARGETVAEKPSFRTSFAKHRCLIPVSGFYEWRTIGGKKQPYFIHPTAPTGFFAFAGLLAAWKAPDGRTIVSTCIITTTPNEVMAPVHDRMPVILGADQYDVWLDPANHNIDLLQQMIKPCDAGLMDAYAVNPLRTDGEECIKPITLELDQ